MSAQEIRTSIEKIERRIHIAEIQNAKPITLDLLNEDLWQLKRELAQTERAALAA